MTQLADETSETAYVKVSSEGIRFLDEMYRFLNNIYTFLKKSIPSYGHPLEIHEFLSSGARESGNLNPEIDPLNSAP